MPTQTTLSLPGNIYSYYHKMLLNSVEKQLRFWGLGTKRIHPKGFGKDSFVLKYGHILPKTTPLSEGITPTSTAIASNKYTITLKQYGDYVPISDFLTFTAIDPVLENVTKKIAYSCALSIDSVIRDHLLATATANIQWVGAGNAADNDITAGEVFTAQDSLKAIRLLRGTDAQPLDDGYYAWVMHPYNSIDVMGDTSAGGFIELNKYVQGLADGPLNGEVGKVYGARIIDSSNITAVANAGAVNVYRTFMVAQEAYVVTTFDKEYMKLIVKQAGSAGTADPLEQIATVGYKAQFGVQYVGGTFTNANGASPDLVIQIRGASSAG